MEARQRLLTGHTLGQRRAVLADVAILHWRTRLEAAIERDLAATERTGAVEIDADGFCGVIAHSRRMATRRTPSTRIRAPDPVSTGMPIAGVGAGPSCCSTKASV